MERPKIGELLVAAGVIESETLESALEKQRSQGGRIGQILVAMGAVDEDMLVRTVARQLEMPVARLRGKQVKQEVLSQLPRHVALKHRCLPVMLDKKGPETLLVAMEDPSDAAALDEVAIAAGRPVRVVLAAPSELDDALARHYPNKTEPEPPPPQQLQPEPEPDPEPEPEEDEEPELLLTDKLGESGGEPELRRFERSDPSVDPLDLGGAYDPIARPDESPDPGEIELGVSGGELRDPDASLGDPAVAHDLGGGQEVDAGHDLRAQRDLQHDLGAHDLRAQRDIDHDLGAEHDPGASAHAPETALDLDSVGSVGKDLGDPGDDLGLDLPPESPRASDSLDDAIDAVRGAGPLPESDSQEDGAAGHSLFGDDPLESTLPPAAPRADGLPRDAELRALVLLLIERGLLTREEVVARLKALHSG